MQRFEYETTTAYLADDCGWSFKEKVEQGWRLVSVVKEAKESFVYFWERP
jgi:hypothetical protein